MAVTDKNTPHEISKTELKREEIIKAALKEFSHSGLHGARIEAIAQAANMSKSNLLYYFEGKENLYLAVLEDVLAAWLQPFGVIQADDNPKDTLSSYIDAKFELSKINPEASKLYALEMIQGAPHLESVLKGSLKKLVRRKTKVIETWIAEQKIKPISPLHLIFHIWAVTQHYADFAIQIEAVSGKSLTNKKFATEAKQTAIQLLVDSIVIE